MVDEIGADLRAAGIENAHQEARWLIEAALDGPFPSTGYFEDDVRERAIALATRRISGEPLQYVTGLAGFRRLELAVGPGVFVPRPESEVLVEHVLGRLRQGGTVVDLGTGSGAIALAIADERPDATVFATEASQDALDWALVNKTRLSSPVEFLHGDLFAPLPETIRGKVDLVVSNPPYIADDERSALPVDVLDHEPHIALFSGTDGTTVIERIAPSGTEWLRHGGWLMIEISPHLQTIVPKILRDHGYEEISVHRDLADRPRVVEARRP